MKQNKNICENCNEYRDLTLILGKWFCAECVKELYFELARKQARKKLVKTDLQLEEEAIKIRNSFTKEIHIDKTLEEMTELAIELFEFKKTGIQPENLISEVADVENMLLQLKKIFKLDNDEIKKIRSRKNNIVLSRMELVK